MHTLAIDIGGTKIALGLVTDGKLIERAQIPTPRAQSAAQFAQVILTCAEQWLPKIDNIGVSTTGLVTKGGISAINPDTLAFPSPFPLAQALESLTNKPVAMLNDAQAAAWYEFVRLETPVKNMAFITVSTGVGGGIIIDGKLHQGGAGLAGHIGHISIDSQGPQCGCGQTGCVEVIASGTAIKKASDAEFTPPISNIDLFEQADSNPVAETIISHSAQAIATLCCNLKATLDLDVIVLGGGVGLAKGYLDRVRKAIQTRPSAFQIPVTEAIGNYDACLLGAAYQFKE
ncbi:N-acetylmannosamine kinase [Vibrio orientalis CIP 102891 = ATCC 33934]|uniref:N-acetylmannosamine kinase n=1 Tax=Vibrio orientalis CIP 102891 = ATCC 33934 TaxID=675816 RepID=C9QER6_VIBOR|nr:N-acetylmannosamine kinase [Vibrio orientalis]EEX94626.1 N-acetylmannosamine kinase [Vibrio orientalis CIP 102891 = ATCC 33934]EGU51323.1 N-acetylmannosamine kinase [Vibrio orientalis CIP 102891 = ATCC 33934]